MGSSKTTTSSVLLKKQGGFDKFLSGSDNDTSEIDNQIAETQGRYEQALSGRNPAEAEAQQRKLEELKKQREGILAQAQTQGDVQSQYGFLKGLVDLGPGSSDVSAGVQSQRELADMLRTYGQQGGNLPTESDINTSNSLAQKLFGAQQAQLRQAFQDQTIEASRRAAIQGRSISDPILAAKLAQEQTRQSNVLNAQQGAWATDWSLQQPMQRLGFMSQRNDILTGLANQAMNNRQSILNLGNQLMAGERAWRSGISSKKNVEESSPGFAGIMSGILSGASLGISAYNSFSPNSFFNKTDGLPKTPFTSSLDTSNMNLTMPNSFLRGGK